MKIKAIVCATLILLLSSLMVVFPADSKEKVVFPKIPRISVEELKKMVDKGAGDFVVVDVRDSASYEAGHIKGAINIYYDANPTDTMVLPMTLAALSMEKLIVTYCDCSDDASSANVAQELYKLGYDRDKVKVLAGGSLRWVELKYPMVKNN